MTYSYLGLAYDQSAQLDEIVTYFLQNHMGKSELIIEDAPTRPRRTKLMAQLQRDDILLVSSLSNLIANPMEVALILLELVRIGVKVISVKGGVIDPNMAAFMQSMVASVQHADSSSGASLTEQRVRRRGRPTGSRLDIHAPEIKRLLEAGLSNSSIARRFDISRQSFKDFAISRGLVM